MIVDDVKIFSVNEFLLEAKKNIYGKDWDKLSIDAQIMRGLNTNKTAYYIKQFKQIEKMYKNNQKFIKRKNSKHEPVDIRMDIDPSKWDIHNLFSIACEGKLVNVREAILKETKMLEQFFTDDFEKLDRENLDVFKKFISYKWYKLNKKEQAEIYEYAENHFNELEAKLKQEERNKNRQARMAASGSSSGKVKIKKAPEKTPVRSGR